MDIDNLFFRLMVYNNKHIPAGGGKPSHLDCRVTAFPFHIQPGCPSYEGIDFVICVLAENMRSRGEIKFKRKSNEYRIAFAIAVHDNLLAT